MNYKCLLPILFLILSFNLTAQVDVISIREANENSRIALADLLGDWYASDSTETKITFVSNGYDVVIEGIRDGVNNYRFTIEEDSVHENGVAMNWPPYYCTLFLRDQNTLEIEFYLSHSEETWKIQYGRKSED